ncbi:MAG: CBS domain-containing protein [Candidatus Latescibacterota bacterium]|nr:MAG: CBS domain-containing protein [Candidatus Latescibacterota bacterium]
MAQFDEILKDELNNYGREASKIDLSIEVLRVPLKSVDAAQAPTLPRGASVADAVKLIQQPGNSCVVVTGEDGKLVGLITERDLCTRVITTGLDLDKATVDDVMTTEPMTLRNDQPLTHALAQMDVGGYRHVPLVDKEGRPAGVITARRVINYIVEFFPEEVRALPPRQMNPARRHGG